MDVNTFLVHDSHMKQDDPQFKLRLPPGLKTLLDEAAKENTRTVGAEIVARLWTTFEKPLEPGEVPVEGVNVPLSKERLAEIIAMLEGGGVSIVPAGKTTVRKWKKPAE